MQFIPFDQIAENDVIIVDGIHAHGFFLSHWKGANIHPGLKDDTSAGVVLKAIQQHDSRLNKQYVTATHFDIDGFIGVWSIFNQELAKQHTSLLGEIARIGDFREIDQRFEQWQQALKIVCWIDETEKQLFYPPFGYERLEENEITLCVSKFNYFLEHFKEVLLHIDLFKPIWKAKFDQVINGLNIVQTRSIKNEYPDQNLVVIHTNEPLSYYALFGNTQGFDIVVSCYSNNRYEVEYKYTTWVDIVSRPVLPRVQYNALAKKLNAIEKNGTWTFDKITDTGPILRLDNPGLTYEQKFDDPCKRTILNSSIDPALFEKTVTEFYIDVYKHCTASNNLSWKEIKLFNRNINPEFENN